MYSLIFLILECSDKNCKTCPENTCTHCYANYYLFPNSSCLLSCPTLNGFYITTENEILYCKSNWISLRKYNIIKKCYNINAIIILIIYNNLYIYSKYIYI